MNQRFFSKPKLIFLLLVALAFSLRCIYFNQTIEFLQPGSGSDSYFYLQWAKSIVRGNILGKDVFNAMPLYPYFLSLAYLFSGGDTFGLILIQLFIGSLNCGLIYILGKKLFNEQVGIISALIACAYLMFIFYDRMLLPASLAIFLGLILALLLLKLKDEPSSKGWFGAGLLLGLSALAGASFSLLTIFILSWIIYEYKKKSLQRRLLYCTSFILPFFLIIAGATFRNYLVAGEPALITAHSGINFYIGNNPQASGIFKVPRFMRPTQSGLIEDARIIAANISGEKLGPSEASNFWFKRSLNFIRARPWNYLRLLAKKLILFWNGREYVDDIEYYIFGEEARFSKLPLFRFSLISALAILGMFLSWPKKRKVMLLYVFIFGFSLATISFFINSRYRLTALPYLIIFAGYAFWHTLKMGKNRQYKNFTFTLVLFLVLYFLTNIKITAATPQLNFTFHYNKGIYLSDQKKYEQAEKEFQTALKINPLDYMSYLGLGNVYYEMQDLPRAINNYEKSLAINPYFYKAHFNLGIIYEEIEHSKQAEEEFKRVLAFNPDDCAAHYNLGRIYQERGLIDAALKEYQAALKIEPEHPEILQAMEELSNEK